MGRRKTTVATTVSGRRAKGRRTPPSRRSDAGAAPRAGGSSGKSSPAAASAWPFPDVEVEVDGRVWRCELNAHRGSGQWRKTHRRRDYYFGPLDQPERALEQWLRRWPGIVRGKDPAAVERRETAVAPESLTLAELGRVWLKVRLEDVAAGQLRRPSWRKYKTHLQRTVDILGKHTVVADLTNEHFRRLRNAAAKSLTPHALADMLVCVRAVMAYAREEFGLDVEPGKRAFAGPRVAEKRRHQAEHGNRPIDRRWLLAMLAGADPHLRPCILLGINGGMGPMDIATLAPGSVELEAGGGDGSRGASGGWIDYARHKTGERRLIWLWPETVAAIQAVSSSGQVAKWPSGQAGVASGGGGPLLRNAAGLVWDGRGTARLSRAWTELSKSIAPPEVAAAIGGDGAEGIGRFYGLRHTFRTVAGRIDRDAARRVMGHRVGDAMDQVYDHDDMRERVRTVCQGVRAWLLGDST